MFKPTKSYNKYISAGQYSLRLGSRVPEEAVNLGYIYTPPLEVSQNIQIADTSSFILENVTADKHADLLVTPDDRGLLKTITGMTLLNSQNFMLTNVFADSTPLYYSFETTYPVVDSAGPDAAGFYQGSSISIRNGQGEEVKGNYKIRLAAATQPKTYKVIVYTDFQTQPDSDIYVVYNALNQTMMLGYQERLNPQPSFTSVKTMASLLAKTADTYYRGAGVDIGQSQIFVNGYPVKDASYRTPVSFKYKIRVTAGATTLDTPYLYDSVYGTASIVPEDDYVNGHKRLRGKVAKDILADFFLDTDLTPIRAAGANPHYSIIVSGTPSVTLYTQDDGNNYVEASTAAATGTISLPRHTIPEKRVLGQAYSVTINDTTPTTLSGTITHLDGMKEIGTVPAGKTFTDNSTGKVSVFQKGTKLYVMTDSADLYFTPQYSLRLSDSQQIKALLPVEKGMTENWYVRVKNGRFDRTQLTYTGIQYVYRYLVPEYFQQEFDAIYGLPYRKVVDERPEIIGDRKIKLRHTPLMIRDNNLKVTVNGIDAVVLNWDIGEGSLEIDTLLKDYDEVKVTSYYEENAFTYRGYYDEVQKRFLHLDVNPSQGHTYSDINPNTGEALEVPSSNLINKTVYLYLRPAVQFASESAAAAGKFIKGSYKNSTLFHTFEELPADVYQTAILIARIQVRPNSSIEDVVAIDTRVRGGGLKESITKEVMRTLSPESLYYWDIGYWDGEPYPENGIMIIRMPNFLLKDYGGKFTKEEVEAVVRRHVGFGNLFLIEYIEAPQQILQMPQNVRLNVVDLP